MSELTVQYERKFSDRNYGSEGLAMSWTWEPEGVRRAANHELHAQDSTPSDGTPAPVGDDDLESLPF